MGINVPDPDNLMGHNWEQNSILNKKHSEQWNAL
jgi:hypothetical protein